MNRSGHGGIFGQPFGNGGFEWIELAGALALGRPLCRRIQVLLDGSPAHTQVALDLTDRPAFGPVQTIQVINLIGAEHGVTSFIEQKPPRNQNDVVGKIPTPGLAGAEVFPKPRLVQELSCCWQDARGLSRPAKPVQPNALGQKLSCCWQDRAAAASGHGPSGVEGFDPRPEDSFRDSVASNQGFGYATYVSYRGTLAGTRRHAQASGDGSRCGAAVGRTAVHRPFAAPDISMVEKGSDSTGNAVRPCWRCRTEAGDQALDLETVIECVPRPRQMVGFHNVKPDGNAVVLFRHRHRYKDCRTGWPHSGRRRWFAGPLQYSARTYPHFTPK